MFVRTHNRPTVFSLLINTIKAFSRFPFKPYKGVNDVLNTTRSFDNSRLTSETPSSDLLWRFRMFIGASPVSGSDSLPLWGTEVRILFLCKHIVFVCFFIKERLRFTGTRKNPITNNVLSKGFPFLTILFLCTLRPLAPLKNNHHNTTVTCSPSSLCIHFYMIFRRSPLTLIVFWGFLV